MANETGGAGLLEGRETMLEVRGNLEAQYPDVLTPEAMRVLEALAPLDRERQALMQARIQRRRDRAGRGQRIDFLDPDSLIGRTNIRVSDARSGNFEGGEIPADLQ